MSHNWKSEYSELKDYIAKNPPIKIGMNIIVIPDNVRHDFYRLFNKVRVAFLRENYQNLLDESFTLRSNYNQAAEEIKKSLGISEIKLSSNLNWFLNDPVDGLARTFYELLFDLLKGKLDTDTFEHETKEVIESSFRHIFMLGYERWVALSLLNMLAPDTAFVIPIDEVKRRCHEIEPDERGALEEELPELEKMETLYMKRDIGEDAFILSCIIVYSTKLNRYVSIGTYLVDATWSAKEVSSKREWQIIRNLGQKDKTINNWPDLVVYMDDQPEDIALVADFSRFCKPEIIVECMEQTDWYQKEGIDKVRKKHNFFNPRLGSYIVTRLPVPEEALNNLVFKPATGRPSTEQQEPPEEESAERSSNIHILNVGYDQSKLSPIIDILLSA